MLFNMKTNFRVKSRDFRPEVMPGAKMDLTMTIRKELRESRSLPTEETRRFITADAVKQIMTSERVNLLLKGLRPKQLERAEKYLRQVLSILVYISWNGWPRFEEIFLRELDPFERPVRGDHQLPFLDLTFLEEDIRETFEDAQYLFRPIIIQENKHLTYTEKHRVPFLESEPIGDGGFGIVTKVVVEKKQIEYNTGTVKASNSKV